jgi:hypothetical protein
MEMTSADWRKSTYSNGQGNCVEVASAPGHVAVRDTTDRDGETLTFSGGAWRTFLQAAPQIKG